MLLRTASTFRRLWIGQFVSTIGDGMQRIALLWWAKQHGGNGLLLAVALSTIVPTIVCSPIGGWFADHLDRRVLMTGADLARFMLSGSLAWLLFSDDPPVALVCAVIVAASIAASTFDPAYRAAVPTIVPDDQLPAANGLDMANGAVGGLVGPLIGGMMIAATGVGWVMVANAATFAWSATCIATCRLPQPAGKTRLDSGRAGVRGTLAELRSTPGIGRLIALAMSLNMVVAPLPMMIAALAVDRLDAGPTTFGMLEMLLSAGLLAGSIASGVLARGRLAVPFHVLGACLAVIGVVPVAGVAIALVVGGVAIAVANAEAMTRFQRSVPGEVQGRMFGVLGSLSESLRPVGLALGAPLLAVAGVSRAFAVIGGCVVLATVAFARDTTRSAPSAPSAPASVASVDVRVARDRPGVPETLG